MNRKLSEQFNLLGLLVTMIILILVSLFFDIESLKDQIGKAGIYASLVFILLKALTIILAPLSGSPLYLFVGVFFGFGPGLIYMIIGDGIGYTFNFFLTRLCGHVAITKMISKKEDGLIAKIVNHISTTRGFLHMGFTLVAAPEITSYAAGLSKLSYIKFISIMLPISAVASAALVYIGSLAGNSQQSFWITTSVLIVGCGVMIGGGWLFVKNVKKK
jgi:uncharacterized membrane protein YdjX (TVP38/TMEM64 family)